MSYLYLDIATAPIDGAEDYLNGDDITAPANYKDQVKIDAYVASERVKRLEKAALDPDLCQITAIGIYVQEPTVLLCPTESIERDAISGLCQIIESEDQPIIVTFGGFRFDLPFLQRRCRYLGVPVPPLNLDRYRSPHVDLYDHLTHHGTVSGHPLSFYVKRLGWHDLFKPLSGAEEARVPSTGQWDALRQSVEHDVIAVQRLAKWMGIT